ncbi:MAG: hypothetical protein LBB72_07010 [Spirochaetaceae bacterium]|jgi:hypothetical protein|nr:hypothetical protein [Spirochaetaceae bacterium]
MINFKVSGIAAGAAFVFSLIIGLISGAAFSAMLLRAFVFALVFFALSGVGFWLVSRYLPELLNGAEAGGSGGGDMDDYDISVPGSRVDISVGETSAAGAFPDDASDAVDDIAGSPSTAAYTSTSDEAALSQAEFSQAERSPLDQGKKTGYNQKRDFTDDIGSLVDPETLEEGQGEELPDMGSIGEGSVEGDVEDGQGMDVESFAPPEPRHASSKKPTVADDFNPRELAKAIQTVLKKDEKG